MRSQDRAFALSALRGKKHVYIFSNIRNLNMTCPITIILPARGSIIASYVGLNAGAAVAEMSVCLSCHTLVELTVDGHYELLYYTRISEPTTKI